MMAQKERQRAVNTEEVAKKCVELCNKGDHEGAVNSLYGRVRFDVDVTDKNSGERFQGSEVGIYTVKDGKVVREEFLPMVS
jgi:hypothetical protein